jgi:hypothetical protein
MASVKTSMPPDFVQQRRETGSGAISMRLAVEIWIAFIDIINKYEKLSKTICLICGEPATKETSGFIFFVCDDCYKEFIKNEKINNNG